MAYFFSLQKKLFQLSTSHEHDLSHFEFIRTKDIARKKLAEITFEEYLKTCSLLVMDNLEPQKSELLSVSLNPWSHQSALRAYPKIPAILKSLKEQAI